MEAIEEHLNFSIQWKGEKVGIAEMKRHYGNYFKGIPHFKSYKSALVLANELAEVQAIMSEIKNEFLTETLY